MRAIVFDDDPDVRRVMLALLSRRGWSAEAFESSRSCLDCPGLREVCQRAKPCCDVIITDFDMPHMNGLELVRRLAQNGCTCRHVAMVSGTWDSATREAARELGCAVFDKPVELDAFTAWLARVEQAYGGAGPASP
jgi:CheY-like chemotaxis protein